jgi:hypothetical protein
LGLYHSNINDEILAYKKQYRIQKISHQLQDEIMDSKLNLSATVGKLDSG